MTARHSEAVTLEGAMALDEADPLSGFRDRFVIHDDPIAYLDGNSLGRPPKATIERVDHLMRHEWGQRLIRSWSDSWVDLPEQVGERLGRVVLGAAPGQTIIADSTSVNLYKVLHAAAELDPVRTEIVVDDANFPTDRYLVESVARLRGMRVRWVSPHPVGGVTAHDIGAVVGRDTAAVLLSHVDYRTGYIADMAAITSVAHECGASVIWDLSHSGGVLPIGLDRCEVDFAVGCTYKYLNAGPGAPAYVYVARRHLDRVRQPIAGWFGSDDIFAMGSTYRPAVGIRRMLSGTPSIAGTVAVDEGVKLVEEAGIGNIRAKAVGLTEMAIICIDSWGETNGVEVVSPRDPRWRGGHVTLSVPDASEVTRKMIAAGVIPDLRHPDLIRIGLSPLTTSYAEAWRALNLTGDIVCGRA